MAISGVDYSKQLAKARQRYDENVDELRSSHKDVLENKEKQFENQIDKRSQNYTTNLREAEKIHASELSDIKDNTKERLRDYKDRFISRNRETLEDFNLRSKEKQKDYDQRLGNLTRSYQQANRSANSTWKGKHDTLRKNAHKQIQENQEIHAKQINSIKDDNQDEISQYKNKVDTDRRKLINRQQDRVQELVQDETNKRMQLREDVSNQLSKLREVNETENDRLKDHFDSTLANRSEKYEKEKDGMQRNFNLMSKNMQRKNIDQKRRISLAARDRIESLEKNQAKNVRSLRSQIQELSEASGPAAGSSETGKVAEVEKRFKSKVDSLKTLMEDVKTRTEYDKKELNRKNRLTVERKNDKIRKMASENEKNLNDFTAKKMTEFKEERADLVDSYRRNANLDRRNSDWRYKALEERSKQRIENQRRQNSEMVENMTQKRQQALDEIQKSFAQEKKEMIDKKDRFYTSNIKDIRQGHHDKLLKKEMSFEEQRMNRMDEFARTKAKLEKQINTAQLSKAQELEYRTLIEAERKEMDQEAHQEDIDNLRAKFEMGLNEVRANARKKISELQYTNDKRLGALTTDYEKMLTGERAEFARKFSQAEQGHNNRYNRLKRRTEIDTAAMKARYEDRIQKLNETFKIKLEQVRRDQVQA